MEQSPMLEPVAAGVDEVIRGAGIAAVTLIVVITVLVIVGFVALFRRRGDAGIRRAAGSGIGELSTRAGSLLVRVDDSLREADDELGFAIAQFGAEAARPFANEIADARARVAEAFRLKQALDDSFPESPEKRREWTLQVIALCEQAQSALDEQSNAFAELRRAEVQASTTLNDLLRRIDDAQARAAYATGTMNELEKSFAQDAIAPVRDHPAEASRLLLSARAKADAAAPQISNAGVHSVTTSLQQAAHNVHRADQLLDSVDRVAHDLEAAERALVSLVERTKSDLAEARTERDKAPDADSGAGILNAIAAVESVLQAVAQQSGPADPVTGLDRIGEAVAELDLALATARNQKQRLEHARTALEGTLVSAKSQISAAREYIGSKGGGVDARTRLAEAERQLMLAEAEADPVEALDTARRAVTHARDADALARFDTMRR